MRLSYLFSPFVVASAFRVLHPLPNATLHTHLIVVSVEFWPGLLPTAETPLWFRFLGENGIASSVRGLGHDVAGLYSASYTFTADYFSAYVGEIIDLEMRLGKDWEHPISQRMVQHTSFILLDDAACEAAARGASAGAGAGAEAPGVRVVDAFPFFGSSSELDILELRLYELAPVVDAFLLVESATTHSGRPKPLHWQEALQGPNRTRWEPFLDKIVAVVAELPREGVLEVEQAVAQGDGDGGPEGAARVTPLSTARLMGAMMEREKAQRNAIAQALVQLSSSGPATASAETLPFGALRPQDVVIVSDADEVPSRRAVNALRYCWPWKKFPHSPLPPSTSSPSIAETRQEVLRGAGSLHVRLVMSWYIYGTDWRSRIPWGLIGQEGAYAARAALLLPAAAFAPLSLPSSSPSSSSSSSSSSSAPPLSNAMGVPSSASAEGVARASDLRRFQRGKIKESGRLGLMALGSWSVLDAFNSSSSGGGGGGGGAGWHFSSFGGVRGVQEKLDAYIGAASFASQPRARAVYTDEQRLRRLLRNGVAYFDLASLAANSMEDITEQHADWVSRSDSGGESERDGSGSTGGGDGNKGNAPSLASLTHFERVARPSAPAAPRPQTARSMATKGIEDENFFNCYSDDSSLPTFLRNGTFRSQGRSGAFVSLFDEGEDVNDDDADAAADNSDDYERSSAVQEKYRLLQDIRRARLLASEEGQFVVDALGSKVSRAGGSRHAEEAMASKAAAKRELTRQEITIECAAPGEPLKAVASFCQEYYLNGAPPADGATPNTEYSDFDSSTACGMVWASAEAGCRDTLINGNGWWKSKIDLDTSLRFTVQTEDGEEYIVEVSPLDDLAEIARNDGKGMGLRSDQIETFEHFLRAKVAENPDFAARQLRWQQSLPLLGPRPERDAEEEEREGGPAL